MTNKDIGVIDCETDPFEHGVFVKPFIWCFLDSNTEIVTRDVSEIIAYVRKRKLIVYAHNGGKFDYNFIMDFVSPQKVMRIGNRLSSFKIGKAEFRDSYNILPFPLSAYNKMEFDYSKLKHDAREKHMDEIIRYVRSDCKI